jgi:DnaJ-domain-containing protein 1
VSRSRYLIALGAVLGGIAVLLVMLAIAVQPLLLFVAIPFGAAGYIIWYHGTGRLAERMRRHAARERAQRGARMGDGAGATAEGPGDPRWTDAEFRQRRERARQFFEGAGRSRPGGGRTRTDRAPTAGGGMSVDRAYGVLGVDPGSGADAVRSAYREKVKEVHPDTEDGDEDSFKRVNEAYETLQERAL